jgi:hypothetical protein
MGFFKLFFKRSKSRTKEPKRPLPGLPDHMQIYRQGAPTYKASPVIKVTYAERSVVRINETELSKDIEDFYRHFSQTRFAKKAWKKCSTEDKIFVQRKWKEISQSESLRRLYSRYLSYDELSDAEFVHLWETFIALLTTEGHVQDITEFWDRREKREAGR